MIQFLKTQSSSSPARRTIRFLAGLLVLAVVSPVNAASAQREDLTKSLGCATPLASDHSLTLQQVEEIALREVPGGHVLSIERDFEWGRAVFEVEMTDADGWELELTIDADDGHVLRRERDD